MVPVAAHISSQEDIERMVVPAGHFIDELANVADRRRRTVGIKVLLQP